MLHDELQQTIVGARFTCDVARRQVDDPAASRVLDRLREQLHDAADGARSLSHELAPPLLDRGDLAGALRWLAERMQERHGLAITVRAGPLEDVPLTLAGLLYGAVQELLFNVVKHAGAGAAEVRISATDERIVVTVADDGAGFDAAGGSGGRSGFGLLAVRERFGLVDGRFEIEARSGGGTRVALTVPFVPADPRPDPQGVAADSRAPAMVAPESRSDGSLRVVLVDDHDVVRQGLAQLLGEDGGVEIVGQAASGEEGVRLCRRHRPDVVVMDLNMPGISGDEATRRIVAERPGTRVVGLSIRAEPEDVSLMVGAGAATHLGKECDPAELIRAIRGE